MARQAPGSNVDLLRYTNAVRAGARRGHGIVAIAALFIALALLDTLASPARAHPAFSDWPSRTVRIVVPFPAGSPNDVAARLYAEGLSRRWIRPVVVENKPGADAFLDGGTFAGTRDDHTLLYGTAAMITVNPLLHEPRPYDAVQDMLPIAPGAGPVMVIAAASGLPARSLKDLVELARSKPGALSWSAGPSLPYFAFATTLKRHRLSMVRVPYQDAATPPTDRGEARAHVLSTSLQAVTGPVAAGQLRILAVTSPRREPLLPDVPTVAEAGFPEMEIEGLSGLFGWRNMPPEVRDRIAADMRALAKDTGLKKQLEAIGQRVLAGTPAEFAAAIGRQRIRIQQIMHIVNLKNESQ
jgi:tripartite-type tricarboxylate transporter receptor subunit TctC